MTRSEGKWLGLGLLLGGVVAAAAIGAVYNRTADEETGGHGSPLSQTAGAAAEPAADADTASAIQLTAEEQNAIGLETVTVSRRAIQRQIITSGKVAEPETGIGTISSRISGRIDELFLNFTGDRVNRGQPVALIYSPAVVTSVEEYRLAIENRQRLNASKESQAIEDADELVRASKRRLELWDVTAEQIDSILTSPGSTIHITTYSPVSGIVTKRTVAEGQYVNEGEVLYSVTDLTTVWVEADIFESDIPLLGPGQSATITSPALGNASLRGTVTFLQPAVDPQTRTMVARIQIPNPQMRLRPGMYVQAALDVRLGGNVLAVPRSAVLDTGTEKIVYIAREDGVFEKRAVEVSAADDEYYAVTRGLEAGERVVTQGNFLIDSQTRLSGNIAGIFGGSKGFDQPATTSNYTVTFRMEPSPPKGASDGEFHASVTGPDGKPVSDAQVRLTLVMPAMPAMGMGEMRSAFELMWNGTEYAGSGTVAMAGPWNVTVEARRNGQLLGVYRSRFDAK